MLNSHFEGGENRKICQIWTWIKTWQKRRLKICFPQKFVCLMNLQKPFYFLVCAICMLTYCSSYTGTHPFILNFVCTCSKVKFCLYVFQGKIPPSCGRQIRLRQNDPVLKMSISSYLCFCKNWWSKICQILPLMKARLDLQVGLSHRVLVWFECFRCQNLENSMNK